MNNRVTLGYVALSNREKQARWRARRAQGRLVGLPSQFDKVASRREVLELVSKILRDESEVVRERLVAARMLLEQPPEPEPAQELAPEEALERAKAIVARLEAG